MVIFRLDGYFFLAMFAAIASTATSSTDYRNLFTSWSLDLLSDLSDTSSPILLLISMIFWYTEPHHTLIFLWDFSSFHVQTNFIYFLSEFLVVRNPNYFKCFFRCFSFRIPNLLDLFFFFGFLILEPHRIWDIFSGISSVVKPRLSFLISSRIFWLWSPTHVRLLP